MKWGRVKIDSKRPVNLNDFSSWLDRLAECAIVVSTPKSISTFEEKQKHQNQHQIQHRRNDAHRHENVFVTKEGDQTKCGYCGKSCVEIMKCKVFLKDTVTRRWDRVKSKGLCFNCFRDGHRLNECPLLNEMCGINGCQSGHHRMLHYEKKKSSNHADFEADRVDEHLELVGVAMNQQAGSTLLRIVPVRLYGKNGAISTYGLFDDGSTITMIDESLATELGLDGPSQKLCIQWTNEMTHTENSKFVNVGISADHENAKKFNMQNVRTVTTMSLPKQTVSVADWQQYPH